MLHMGLPDFSAVRDRCTHRRHLLSHSDAACELSQGDGSNGAPDQQEVCRGGGVGEAWGPEHVGLDGQLVLAGVQLADEGGLLLGL